VAEVHGRLQRDVVAGAAPAIKRLDSPADEPLTRELPPPIRLEEGVMAKMSRSALEVMQAWYQAFQSGDRVTLRALLDENVQWHTSPGFPFSGPYTGPDAVLTDYFPQFFALVGEFFERWTLVLERLIESGETVVAVGRWDAAHRATGAAMVIPFVHLWELTAGKITSYTLYTDTYTFRQATSGRPIRH
jgi:ketosteroid isomerase-like protein